MSDERSALSPPAFSCGLCEPLITSARFAPSRGHAQHPPSPPHEAPPRSLLLIPPQVDHLCFSLFWPMCGLRRACSAVHPAPPSASPRPFTSTHTLPSSSHPPPPPSRAVTQTLALALEFAQRQLELLAHDHAHSHSPPTHISSHKLMDHHHSLDCAMHQHACLTASVSSFPTHHSNVLHESPH